MMEEILDLLGRVAGDVGDTFSRVWPFLAISVVAAAAVSVYVGTDRVATLLRRRTSVATGGAVLLATLTPFCSCGTAAVLLGMLATAAPWAPLVAFMVASPLTSPSELVFSAGLLGWPFALIFFVGTIVLGLAAGSATALLDRLGWLEGQARVDVPSTQDTVVAAPGIGPGTLSIAESKSLRRRWKVDQFISELLVVGRKLLLFFIGFTAVGYVVIEAIPTAWLTDYLGAGSALAIPLAAVLGVPAYINTEASLPLLAALMGGGMGPGPAMAFLVTGAGTSFGAISGLFVIARKRVVGLVVALLFVGAVAMGLVAAALL
ncbi:MAG: permease [Nitrospirota bacterium]